MKSTILLSLIFLTLNTNHFSKDIPSKVYTIDKIKAKKTMYGELRKITSGSSRDFKNIDISLITLNQGNKFEIPESGEKLLIIKSGVILTIIAAKNHSLGKGSAVVLGSNQKGTITNESEQPAEFYLFQYESSAKSSESKNPFQPIIANWEDIEYKTHDKGGIRNFFNQKTEECIRFEMHVTNLNAGIKSHEPHTHRAGEFVLVTKGNTEMEIAGKNYQGNKGDLYFLESEVSHAIKNIGTEQCQYFAFQME